MEKTIYPTLIIFTTLLPLSLLSPLKIGNAYLDPGSGSFILQLIIAGAVGAAFALRAYWSKIKNAVRKTFSRDEKPQNNEE